RKTRRGRKRHRYASKAAGTCTGSRGACGGGAEDLAGRSSPISAPVNRRGEARVLPQRFNRSPEPKPGAMRKKNARLKSRNASILLSPISSSRDRKLSSKSRRSRWARRARELLLI